MKFDSLSRIFLVAVVASGISLAAQAGGQQHPRQQQQPSDSLQGSGTSTRMLDGQTPPPKPATDRRHKRKHAHKTPPPHKTPPAH
jgi:hypothetical protein